jgi:flagellar basal-body rod modification protein FlgD
MTSITPIDSSTLSAETQASAPIKILGKNDFLNLLVTQLQHQDPLNPTESTEFTAQLAQFSSLEQLNNINDNLKNMELFQTSMTNSQAVSYIGKKLPPRAIPCNSKASGRWIVNLSLRPTPHWWRSAFMMSTAVL